MPLSTTTGSLFAFNVNNAPTPGIEFQVALKAGNHASGVSLSRDTRTVVSDGTGKIEVELIRLTTYVIRRRNTSGAWGDWVEFTTPDAATFNLPEVLS